MYSMLLKLDAAFLYCHTSQISPLSSMPASRWATAMPTATQRGWTARCVCRAKPPHEIQQPMMALHSKWLQKERDINKPEMKQELSKNETGVMQK